jgi:hypothetical protein
MPLNYVTGIPRQHRDNIPKVYYGVGIWYILSNTTEL